MKCRYILLVLILYSLSGKAQSIIFHNMKDFVAGKGDTILAPSTLTVEKRGVNRQLLKSGGDYSITSNRTMIRKGLRNKYFAIEHNGKLYVNCKKLRIKKFRFGKCYAPAMAINDKVYFSAVPVGPAALSVVNRQIGMGVVGEAVASSAAINKRVYYEIDCTTGMVEFVGKEKMLQLLSPYPELKEEYQQEENEEAQITGAYLNKIKNR